MEVKDHGEESMQAQDCAQAAEGQEPQMQEMLGNDGSAGKDAAAEQIANNKPDFEKMIVERDSQIEELRTQIAEAAKSAEAAEKLANQIEELKAQAADDKLEYSLKLAGCRNVKAAKALIDEHDGDVSALKAAEPWMFEDEKPSSPKGKTGLAPAGASREDNATLKRWRKLAGLDDEE